MADFERFRKQNTIVMTTFRRDGRPVHTPVSIAVAVDPDVAYVRTWNSSGKAKRLRNNPRVTIAPSSFRGKVTGEPIVATASLLSGEEAKQAARLLRRKHPLLHGLVVPLIHKLRRNVTQHYVLRPAE